MKLKLIAFAAMAMLIAAATSAEAGCRGCVTKTKTKIRCKGHCCCASHTTSTGERATSADLGGSSEESAVQGTGRTLGGDVKQPDTNSDTPSADTSASTKKCKCAEDERWDAINTGLTRVETALLVLALEKRDRAIREDMEKLVDLKVENALAKQRRSLRAEAARRSRAGQPVRMPESATQPVRPEGSTSVGKPLANPEEPCKDLKKRLDTLEREFKSLRESKKEVLKPKPFDSAG